MNINWPVVTDAAIKLAALLIPVAFAWVMARLQAWIATHTTKNQQDILEKITVWAVQSAEQLYPGSNQGAAKLVHATTLLRTAAAQRAHVNLTDVEAQSLIETFVRAINAGAVALAPGTAAVLPPDAQVTSGLDVPAIMAQVQALATSSATGAVQDVMRSLFGAAVTGSPGASVGATPPSPPTVPVDAGQSTNGTVSPVVVAGTGASIPQDVQHVIVPSGTPPAGSPSPV